MSSHPQAPDGNGAIGHGIQLEYETIHGRQRVGIRRASAARCSSCSTGSPEARGLGAWMTLLQQDFTVIAPDFVGHGSSDKPSGSYSLGNLASWTA